MFADRPVAVLHPGVACGDSNSAKGSTDAGKIAAERLSGGLFKADASVGDTGVQVRNDPSAQNPVEAKTHVR